MLTQPQEERMKGNKQTNKTNKQTHNLHIVSVMLSVDYLRYGQT